MAIGTTAAILGGLAVAGTTTAAVTGANAASKAANAQAAAADQAAQVQRESLAQQQKQFDQSRADIAPWREAGTNALAVLSDKMGLTRPSSLANVNAGNPQFQEDPGYKFAFDQGLRAVDSRFPGMSKSGAKAKALTQFGQGIADQQYGNWLQRFATMAGLGQNAANTSVNINAANSNAIGQNANSMGNLIENAAAARASGYVGGANSINSAISGGVNNLALIGAMGGLGGSAYRYDPMGT